MTLDDSLYSAREPFEQGWLDVGDGHRLHFEQCGNPEGVPALFLHGGPGSGCNSAQRRFFDPARYRAVFFDQRGCGRSEPLGELNHNHTAALLGDIEALRRHLGIARWLLFGGSWGASLAIAYAASHPAAVSGLILRGIFLTGRRDLDWFFQDARRMLPDTWQEFASVAPPRWRRNLLHYYARMLHGRDPARAVAAAASWAAYERALLDPLHDPVRNQSPPAAPAEEMTRLVAKYRVQSQYLTRHCFLGEKPLLAMASRLQHHPLAILHGRLDLVCPAENAWIVHRTVSGSRLRLVAGTGHSPYTPPMARSLVSAADHFAAHGDFKSWEGT